MATTTRYHILPKQSLGQNFLIDENIARKIVREMNIAGDDVILEIGPGMGSLTKQLAAAARRVIAVEIDGRVVEVLQNTFSALPVTILHGDFLETDLSAWHRRYRRRMRIVGNIPYHLTSPILFKVMKERLFVEDLTIMIQREVAQRIVASPGSKEYGILSVFCQFYGTPAVRFTVSPDCFYPKPKVTSALLRLQLETKSHSVVNEETFSIVVRTSFGKRRKTLRNSLSYLPYDERVVERILEELDFPMELRPEQLTVEQFAELSRGVHGIISRKWGPELHRLSHANA